MKLLQITYTAVCRDAYGIDSPPVTDFVYLKLRDDIAQDAQNGIYDISLKLAIQLIAELQGYSYAQITSICG